jgi:hypothetical protein
MRNAVNIPTHGSLWEESIARGGKMLAWAIEAQALRDAAAFEQPGYLAEGFQVLLWSLGQGRAEEYDEASRGLEGKKAQTLRTGSEKNEGLDRFLDMGVEQKDAGLEFDGLPLRYVREEGGEPR